MPTVHSMLSRPKLRRFLGSAVFFLLFYLYVWLWIDPGLIYHSNWTALHFPCFWLGRAFAVGFLAYPGGPVEYVSAFLCQLYYYPWLGAGVITLVAALLSLSTGVLAAAVSGIRPRVLHLVPAVLFLLPYAKYANPMAAGLAALAAMLLSCAYVLLSVRRPPLRLAVFFVLAAAAYYVAGGALLLYLVLAGAFEVVSRRQYLYGLLWVALAAAIPYAGAHAFRIPLSDAYLRLLPFDARLSSKTAAFAALLYVFVPLCAIGLAFGRRMGRFLAARGASRERRTALSGAAALVRFLAERPAGWVVQSAVLFTVAAVPLLLRFDAGTRTLLRIDCYAQQGMWRPLLQEATCLPLHRYRPEVEWDVNRALYHTGQLLDRMFCYPQGTCGLFPIPREFSPLLASSEQEELSAAAYMKCADLLFELGRVNESEVMTHETWELIGPRPRILKRLALVNAAKGRTEAARVFLRALRKDLVHGEWARDRLRRLEADPRLADEAEVERLRSAMVLEDAGGHFSREEMLLQLLARDRHNRMAFEYLIAHYLLTRQLGKFALHIDRLDEFGYGETPSHCEEAMVLYAAHVGGRSRPWRRPVSRDTALRFRRFLQVLAQCRDRKSEAWSMLLADYRDSYFPYYVFREPEEPQR